MMNRSKSEFQKMVDQHVQFGGNKINVLSIPLLISEGSVYWPEFIYQFYRWFQYKPFDNGLENEIDDRLDVNDGLRYTLDLRIRSGSILAGLEDVMINERNRFIYDWITKLITDPKTKEGLSLQDQPEYWAMKIKLESGTLGWIFPKKAMVLRTDGQHDVYFDFVKIL